MLNFFGLFKLASFGEMEGNNIHMKRWTKIWYGAIRSDEFENSENDAASTFSSTS